MQLVLNVNRCFDSFSFEETAKMVKAAGFDAVDCSLFQMTNSEHVLNGDDWLRNAEAFRNTFSANSVPVVQCHAPYQFKGYGDPVIFQEQIYPITVRAIEVAAALGARYVVVHPFHYGDCAGDVEATFRQNMTYYRSLIPVCRANGIKVCVENMFSRDKLRGNYIVHDCCSRVEEFCRYIDAVDSEYVVACLDIGHTALVSGGVDPWDYIRILGHDRLHTLHIHDNDFREDMHITPFSGKIDWYKTCQALGQINYKGDMVYECLMNRSFPVMDPAMYPVALSYMAQIGRHLIACVENAR